MTLNVQFYSSTMWKVLYVTKAGDIITNNVENECFLHTQQWS